MSLSIDPMEDYIKEQIRELIQDDKLNNQIKRRFQSLGLYNRRQGFAYRRYFIDSESISIKQKFHRRQFNTFDAKQAVKLPSLRKRKHKKRQKVRKGIINTRFFRKHSIVITAAMLSNLFQKVDVIHSPIKKRLKGMIKLPYDRLISLNRAQVALNLVTAHLINFMHVSEFYYLSFGVGKTQLELPEWLNNQIAEVFQSISDKIVKRFSPQNIHFQQLMACITDNHAFKEIGKIIAKVYFRRYSKWNFNNFKEFVLTYLLTNQNLNQKHFGFDIYDYLDRKVLFNQGLYKFFRNPIFPLIEEDIQQICQALGIELQQIKEFRLRQFQENQHLTGWNDDPPAINIKQFNCLEFAQEAPNIILVLQFMLFGQQVVDWYTQILQWKDFIVLKVPKGLKLRRWRINVQRIKDQYENEKAFCKRNIKHFQIPQEYHNGAIITFLLLCDVVSIIKSNEFYISNTSFKHQVKYLLHPKLKIISHRFLSNMLKTTNDPIQFRQFIEYVKQFLIFDTKHQATFDIWNLTRTEGLLLEDIAEIRNSEEGKIEPNVKQEIDRQFLKRLCVFLYEKVMIPWKKCHVLFDEYTKLIEQPSITQILIGRFKKNCKNEDKYLNRVLNYI